MRSVFRRIADNRRLGAAVVIFSGGPGGLHIQCRSGDWAAEYFAESAGGAVSFGIPLASLADFEGSTCEEVVLSPEDDRSVVADWTDGGIPRRRTYASVGIGKTPLLVTPCDAAHAGDFDVIAELAEVCRSAASEATRYVLNCIQLRGERGDAVATDGRQMLIASGFSFPWRDSVLVPRTKLFEAKEFASNEPTAIARTEDHVILLKGRWRLWLPIEKNGRFPDVDPIVPATHTATTSVQLAPTDAEFLLHALPRLPGAKTGSGPVTIHCNGHVAVRSAAEESAGVTELMLDGSTVAGDEVLVAARRDHLLRMAALGVTTIHFWGDQSPAVGAASRRRMVWKPVDGESIPADPNATVLHSGARVSRAPIPQLSQRTFEPMNHAAKPEIEKQNEPGELQPQYASAPADAPFEAPIDPIVEVDAIKETVRGALTRLSRLGVALRRHQKTAKLVKSTLLSLKQLGDVG